MASAAARAERAGTPVLAVIMAPGVAPPGARVPVYATPEQAARALGHMASHAHRRRRLEEPAATPPGVDRDSAAATLAQALAAGEDWLAPDAVAALLEAYGIPLSPIRVAGSPEAAATCAAAFPGPVALKAVVPGLQHKTDAGGVQLGLQDPDAVMAAARRMQRRLGAERFVVQAMVPAGVEMLVGVVSDPQFGPVVACGAGGTAVELLGDVAVRLAPVGAREASDMVRALRTFPLLDGYRGAPRADVAALEDVVARVGALAAAHAGIAELDLNPVVVSPRGAVAVDARVRVAVPEAAVPFPSVGS